MKQIIVKPKLLLYLKDSDPRNTIGLQLRIWGFFNSTELLVRMENQEDESKRLYDGKKTIGEVNVLVKKFLHEKGMIKNLENWDYSASHTSNLKNMDEYEDKEKCKYYGFFVKKHLINF
jgi:hypothetical protein